jgi:DNA-binding NarL/FixJ family response regulator
MRRARTGVVGSFELGGKRHVVVELSAATPEVLTTAEQEIARALVDGLTAAQIARQRGTSRRTVEHQVAAIFARLGCHSRAELVRALARTNYP